MPSDQVRQNDDSDYGVLRDLCYALFRSNIDWAAASQDCGDPECDGDCKYIATVRQIVRAIDGGILPGGAADLRLTYFRSRA